MKVGLTPELLEALRRAELDAWRIAPLSVCPKIEFRRYRVTAGCAVFATRTIRLSPLVLNTPAQIRETYLHEYAHLLAFERCGLRGRGHGPAWRQCMAELGLEPKVYHQFQVKRNQIRTTIAYECAKCGVAVERRRKLDPRRNYLHVGCGGAIRQQTLSNYSRIKR